MLHSFMTLDEFQNASTPPEFGPLAALWHDRQGDWAGAHEAVQDDPSTDAAWVHAYLHRKEGDTGNARYWYSRADQPEAAQSFDEEWAAIASVLLARL
jgi:hypothetical protein